MQNFANQCLDMARSVLGHNLSAINEDGTVLPLGNEVAVPEESAHALAAMGEFYRATRETTLGDFDIVDLGARCLTHQVFAEGENNRALAYSALGLLAFGPAKQRNLIWERLMDPTREQLDKRLLARTHAKGIFQAFNIAKAVARYSMGLTKKDETGRLIDKFLEQIQETSTHGFFSDETEHGIGGVYDVSGLMCFIFIRQALKLHVNLSLCERKLPSLRTFAEKYLKLFPDLVRSDGLGWAYGRGVGVYGQMYCISMILQFLRDGWIGTDKKPIYLDLLRRLFQYFFVTYLDQENGALVVNDVERSALLSQTTRIVNFDAARYLCQWSRLANVVGISLNVPAGASKTSGRFIIFDKSNQKEQGVFTYQSASSKLHVQLPLVSGRGKTNESDALAFPHCPGVFDWPVNTYLPILLPELTLGTVKVIPSYYGKRCTTGLGLNSAFFFRYEQPELISHEETMLPGLGSCKVSWTFTKDEVKADFIFRFKQAITLDAFRYVIPICAPHSRYRLGNSLALGENSLQAIVLKDDFGASWQDIQDVIQNLTYKTYYGKICYLQVLARTMPLNLQVNKEYQLQIQLQPDIQWIAK
ncbi:MAG: hypothetical protein LBF43_01305 [Puniceicoccales bacterium]|jgi:hypothetical protein|nr:hypothetical protein [Puniceicoccales bacterium]